MNTHPYLRAFLAGILVPTLVLPLLAGRIYRAAAGNADFVPDRARTGVSHGAGSGPVGRVEHALAVVATRRTHLPLGVHGALLPLLMVPVGALIATHAGVLALAATSVTWFNAITVPYALIACFLAAAIAAYYLAWKYIVGFVNRVLGIA